MPRKARIDAPGAVHHIIVRGIERGTIFHDDKDRNRFIKRLGDIVFETKTQCFAWALIPNHFHLLLKTGNVPIATVMRRLLTGYAVNFNRRHNRSGHLFQNRYKSILCQEDVYLKELIRYIHLNPLRARLVKDILALKKYPYSGHSYLMGSRSNNWQSINEVLSLFSNNKKTAIKQYQAFLIKGIEIGRQPDLVGGGLVRSAGGWSVLRSMRKAGIFEKSDERILGDGAFVDTVLKAAKESMETKYALSAKGVVIEDILQIVSKMLSIHPKELKGVSKERTIVKGRALVCYWSVRELGMTMTEVAGYLGITLPTVSVAVKRGMKIVLDENLKLTKLLNVNI